MRADRQNDAEGMIALVRSALPMLLEDPPLALGASLLAQHLLPAHSDSLRRGMLQHALRQALARLRTARPISSLERPWWPYVICSGEYEAGQARAELQEQLALSVSTYTRAKRHGLERISAYLGAQYADADARRRHMNCASYGPHCRLLFCQAELPRRATRLF